MTVLIEKKKLLVVTAPKVACSSIKRALFEVENGFEFRSFHANGVFHHVHDRIVYPAIGFSQIPQDCVTDCMRFTVVRDPIKRLLSAYSNRTRHYKELSRRHIGEAAELRGIPENPELEDFVEHFEAYREISPSIRLHTDPLCHFIGNSPDYYHHVYDISQLDDFAAAISAHIGAPFTLGHFQDGGPKFDIDALSQRLINKLTEFYKDDYAAYGRYML